MIEEIKEIIINGKLNMVNDAVSKALESGIGSDVILDNMIVAMNEVGDKFQNNDIYVPEMLIAAKTMERGVTILKPHLSTFSENKYGTIIIGSVAGDLHDIGKNLVALMMQSAGFNVVDLGIDVPAEDFVKAVKDYPDCKIVALSALLTVTLDSLRETVEYIKKSKACRNIKIMVGGRPVTQNFADSVGADAYTANAVDAAKVAKELIGAV